MNNTNNLEISLLEQSQAQKEVTINEAIFALEALQNRGVEDKDLATPPVSPANGDAYIVASTATADWLGQENAIAYFNQSWKFITPNEGLFIWVKDEEKLYYFDGSSWQKYVDNFDNISQLGINASADATNKFAVSSSAILFNNIGDNIQTKINKNTVGDTASFIFQSGFSGRAEFGLIGDDNFSLKVSDDGSTFNESFKIDAATGDVDFKTKLSIGSGDSITGVLTKTVNLDFPAISANSSQSLTTTLTGAAIGDNVIINADYSGTGAIVFQGYVSSANIITVKAINATGGSINPASLSFRITIIQF